MAKTTTFRAGATAGSGQFSQFYLWSDPRNWTNGIPTTGDTVVFSTAGTGITVDDLPNLSLASILDSVYQTVWVNGTLTVSNFSVTSGELSFDALAGAKLFDNAPTDSGNVSFTSDGNGSEIVFSGSPTSSEFGWYNAGGIVAFTNPGSTITAPNLNSPLNDTLELPGTTVQNLTMTQNGPLTVTTDAGTFTFTKFGSYSPFNYKTSYDASLGLVAITFEPGTAPKQTEIAPSGPAKGQYVWSDPNNWSNGTPGNGTSTTVTFPEVDDITKLTLDNLTLTSTATYLFIEAFLTVNVLNVTSGITVESDLFAGGPANAILVVNHLTGSGAHIGANGLGSLTEILDTIDYGESYFVSYGGELLLNATLSASSSLSFTGTGIIALEHAAATSIVINGAGPGDVLELSGSSVQSLSLSGTTLSVTTDVSTYTFDHFNWSGIEFYSWYVDSATGLVAVEFFGNPPVHDTNGDFRSDLLWLQDNGNVFDWEMNGTTIGGGGLVATMNPATWHVAAQGDFNGDQKSDIVWEDTSGNLYLWAMNGNQVSSSTYFATMPSNFSVKANGDFDGDGRADMLWYDGSNGNMFLWTMNGAQVTSGPYVATMSPSTWHLAASGDFDGDGKMDLLWQNTGGDLYLWTMNGSHATSGNYVATMPTTSWTLVAAGDVNGDGKMDLIWQDKSNGNLYVWDMDGSHVTSGGYLATQSTSSWHLAASGDFSGDAKTDLLWQDTSGNLFEWQLDNTHVVAGGYVATLDQHWTIAPH